MRFEQVQRFILAKKIFWGYGHFKNETSMNGAQFRKKMKIYPQALTFLPKPQICSFRVVVLLTKAKKWTKVKSMHVQSVQSNCLCSLNMQICDVLVAVGVVFAEAPYCLVCEHTGLTLLWA